MRPHRADRSARCGGSIHLMTGLELDVAVGRLRSVIGPGFQDEWRAAIDRAMKSQEIDELERLLETWRRAVYREIHLTLTRACRDSDTQLAMSNEEPRHDQAKAPCH